MAQGLQRGPKPLPMETVDGDQGRDLQSHSTRTRKLQDDIPHCKDMEQMNSWDLGSWAKGQRKRQCQHLSVPKIQENQRDAEAGAVEVEGSSAAGRAAVQLSVQQSRKQHSRRTIA